MSELDHKIVRNTAWVALSYGGSQAVGFAVLVALAHLLTPAEFGLVSLASIVVIVVSYLQESGLGMAVIREREAHEESVATMWVFMVVGSVIAYLAVFALAPVFARLFSQTELTSVIRVLAVLLILRAVGSTAGAQLERELGFRRRAKAELAGAAMQAATAVPLAVAGLGVWSLVVGQLASQAVTSGLLIVLAPFHPDLRLASWGRFRELAKFGRHVTIGNILLLANTNADNIVTGKLLGTTELGYYSMAWRIANLPSLGLSFIVGRVMFPAYATIRDDLPAFRRAFVLNVKRVALVAFPVALGIVICAEPIVIGLFGDSWSPAVTPLRILGVFGLIRSFAGPSGAVFQAAGRPQLVYQTGLWYSAVLLGSLAGLAEPFGINGVAAAMTIAMFCVFVPSWALAFRILDLRLRDLLSELADAGWCALALAGSLVAATLAVRPLDPTIQLIILVALGFVVYALTMLTIGRAELRSIRAAFRSGSVAES